ncbi:MAG: hypothetical protein Kow00124_21860 [Anaerolineae bacterium]
MSKELTDLSFEDWLAYVFDHPVEDPAWYWDPQAEWWDARRDPVTTIAYITRAFEQIEDVAALYTEGQIAQGLWFLVDSSSEHMLALLDEAVPLAARLRCIRSFYRVYEALFLPRCSSRLIEPGDSPPPDPLDLICYMWWDILPVTAQPDKPGRHPIDFTALEVMAQTLALDSPLCAQAALHGLGHWQPYYPDEVQHLIDEFLVRHPDLAPELVAYAHQARSGCVL